MWPRLAERDTRAREEYEFCSVTHDVYGKVYGGRGARTPWRTRGGLKEARAAVRESIKHGRAVARRAMVVGREPGTSWELRVWTWEGRTEGGSNVIKSLDNFVDKPVRALIGDESPSG